MKAIFIVPTANHNMVLPPLQSEDGELQLQYIDGKTLKGGYSAIGHIVQKDIALCLIDADEATIKAMNADKRWTFVEEVRDVETAA